MDQLLPSFSIFLLVLVRVTTFFIMMPLFSHRSVPAVFRIGFSFFLSLLIYYTIHVHPFEINGEYFFLLIKEALVGLLISFVAYMIFSVIQIAGSFIDFQMGFSMANVIDPQTGAQSPLVGQYLYSFALLFLLAVNGHHIILDGIYYSYQFIPIDQTWIPLGHANLAEYLLKIMGQVFVIAFQMSIPVVAVLFLVDVALGIVARTVPQLNLFVVGFPVKIAVSFFIMIVTMGTIFVIIQHLFESMFYIMRNVMQLLGGTI
ncbi:flagellar type III secretion system protein FliR [Bacillus ginsengihumi]|uniref:Flagellar biosynthetic protein FliR n=1 Tax=Heyndrickxia ginsengihumi TaxID=363870 RepID=A0A0A6VE05_9BACI|nr:flagellar biosynthetic protein FliR [Heyndrickxia ginsengihumi]KHD86515.1 flagellar biosynthesis protein FliR [Heyndrickxia ginsengihumi]MBE6182768.1 flagellar type III secretion system protein FliR [Bacillus sp. (in: firmicutes)]MCM3022508.1 flagellar type III secretion system protein FliR [Heyndrickxia ginsengihumi]NEY19628.1 flagellar type III secretion system protein FliR [Heyndrickxia ginsengihumi]